MPVKTKKRKDARGRKPLPVYASDGRKFTTTLAAAIALDLKLTTVYQAALRGHTTVRGVKLSRTPFKS